MEIILLFNELLFFIFFYSFFILLPSFEKKYQLPKRNLQEILFPWEYYFQKKQHSIFSLIKKNFFLFLKNIFFYFKFHLKDFLILYFSILFGRFFFFFFFENNMENFISLNVFLFEKTLFFWWDLEFYFDPISRSFILLTLFLTPICLLLSLETIYKKINFFFLFILFIEFFLILAFSSATFLFFYISFESILIPMFFIIGIWGSRRRKIIAAYYLFLYTVVGSIFFLLGIFYLDFLFGIVDYYTLMHSFFSQYQLSIEYQILIFKLFFLAFAVKVPMYPLHLWLPEAHVEAPTAGSVILAGLLLKLGGFGFYRFVLSLCPLGVIWGRPIIFTLASISIVYSSFNALRQLDMKRIIAYSSIAHMNFAIIGLFTPSISGIVGSIYLMLGHGLVSSALFILIGSLYYRYKTRMITYYGGLAVTMPFFVFFLFFFLISNIPFPGTVNFIGEYLILLGMLSVSRFLFFFIFLGAFLCTAYSILFLARVSFGEFQEQLNNKTYFNYIQKFKYIKNIELFTYEFVILIILLYFTIYFGLFPEKLTFILYLQNWFNVFIWTDNLYFFLII